MSVHLQVVFDVVTRKASYRFTLLERPPAGLLVPPGLSNVPASVVCSRPEGLRVCDDKGAKEGLVPELDLDVLHQDLARSVSPRVPVAKLEMLAAEWP